MLGAHDMSLVQRDPELKGLRYVLDAGSLRELLEGEGLPAAAMLEGLSVDYLRYKPGANCIARLRFASGFGYAKAFAADAATKLANARRRPEVAGPLGVGRVCLDEQGIMLNFFPNDMELRSLAHVVNPAMWRELLKRTFKADPSWHEANYTPLNYKPERRFVARLACADGQKAVIKFYSKKEFASIRLSRKKFSIPQGLQMPQWIGGSKSHRVMAYSWLPGVTLNARLETGHSEEASKAGEAVARLHLGAQPELARLDTEGMMAMLKSLGEQLGHLVPDLAGKANEVSRKLAKWVQGREHRSCLIHGDFYDEQVTVENGAVGIIDSDRIQLGDPELDLGCFMAHLELSRIAGVLSADQVEKTQTALVDGYLAASPPNFIERNLNPFTAFNLFQLSHNPFRDRRPAWAEDTASLLARCDQLLTVCE